MIIPGAVALPDLRAVMGGARLDLDPSWRGWVQSSVDALRARLAGVEASFPKPVLTP